VKNQFLLRSSKARTRNWLDVYNSNICRQRSAQQHFQRTQLPFLKSLIYTGRKYVSDIWSQQTRSWRGLTQRAISTQVLIPPGSCSAHSLEKTVSDSIQEPRDCRYICKGPLRSLSEIKRDRKKEEFSVTRTRSYKQAHQREGYSR